MLDLGDEAIVVLGLSDDLSDCVFPRRVTRQLVLCLRSLELGLISHNPDFICGSIVLNVF